MKRDRAYSLCLYQCERLFYLLAIRAESARYMFNIGVAMLVLHTELRDHVHKLQNTRLYPIRLLCMGYLSEGTISVLYTPAIIRFYRGTRVSAQLQLQTDGLSSIRFPPGFIV